MLESTEQIEPWPTVPPQPVTPHGGAVWTDEPTAPPRHQWCETQVVKYRADEWPGHETFAAGVRLAFSGHRVCGLYDLGEFPDHDGTMIHAVLVALATPLDRERPVLN